MDTKPLKILSLPVDFGGCGWYRIRQPFHMITEHTDSETHVIEKDEDGMRTIQAMYQADILVFRQGGELGIDLLKKAMLDYCLEIKKPYRFPKIVLDIDDNIELISPYSQHYEDYGTNEYFDKHSNKWLWKDGENNFDVRRNRKKVMSLMAGMRQVDLVTVTTKKLAEYARQFNPNVAVLNNFVDLEKWWRLSFKENKQLRVGWSGGISHYEDWYSIKEPLNKLLRKYRFKLISVGAAFTGIIDEDLRDLVEVWPWVPFEAHSYRMMCMNLDIAIIPLANLPFNQYKSSIKFYEMSAMGIPSVVSNVLPYSEDATLTNSSPYENAGEFISTLEKLITQPVYRNMIGRKARTFAQSKDAKKNAHLWVDAYRKILPVDERK